LHGIRRGTPCAPFYSPSACACASRSTQRRRGMPPRTKGRGAQRQLGRRAAASATPLLPQRALVGSPRRADTGTAALPHRGTSDSAANPRRLSRLAQSGSDPSSLRTAASRPKREVLPQQRRYGRARRRGDEQGLAVRRGHHRSMTPIGATLPCGRAAPGPGTNSARGSSARDPRAACPLGTASARQRDCGFVVAPDG
jgi:hypothetical protein